MGIHPVTIVVFLVVLAAGVLLGVGLQNVVIGGAVCILAVLLLMSLRVARQWQKAVVLRLGKYESLKGPGLFYILPMIDTVPYWIDLRTVTTPFNAEETLTSLIVLEPLLAIAIVVGAMHTRSFRLETVLSGSVYATNGFPWSGEEIYKKLKG